VVQRIKKNNLGEQVSIIIVANKLDKSELRVVSEEQGKAFASQRNCDFVEISCKTGDNFNKLMDSLTIRVMEQKNKAM